MDILSFISGSGLFLVLAIALIVIYVINRRKRR